MTHSSWETALTYLHYELSWSYREIAAALEPKISDRSVRRAVRWLELRAEGVEPADIRASYPGKAAEPTYWRAPLLTLANSGELVPPAVEPGPVYSELAPHPSRGTGGAGGDGDEEGGEGAGEVEVEAEAS